MRKITGSLTAVAVLGMLAGSAHAQFNAYSLPTPVVGTQAFQGSLGLDFDVNTSIEIFRLGVFDSNQDGLVNAINVAIYNRNTQTVVAGLGPLAFIGTGDVLDGAYRFRNIAPVLLTPGQYSVVASGFSSADPNGNTGAGGFPTPTTNTGGGVVSYVGGGRFEGTPGVYPTIIDGGPAARYGAGNFSARSLSQVAAPEPATGLLFGFALLPIAGLRRRK